MLRALGDGATVPVVREAHDAAVDAAMGFVEREAARTRRGAGGIERVRVEGLIPAAFRHRTSRAGDPLLHTHVLVANLARTSDDEVWRTLESRMLFLFAKTTGYLYQAQLRHELTRRLGVRWETVTNGYADLTGVPRWLIHAFSRRRQAILQRLDEVGEFSVRAAQVATLETRMVKEGQASEAELRRAWATRADLLRRVATRRHPGRGCCPGRPRRPRTAGLRRHPIDHDPSGPRGARRPPAGVTASSGSVLVVDKAGMVGTRVLARLLDHAAHQRVEVVLVGDPHQLRPALKVDGVEFSPAVLGSPELYREWGYVALSRGRESNRLYIHGFAEDLDPELDQHGRQEPSDPMASSPPDSNAPAPNSRSPTTLPTWPHAGGSYTSG